MKILVTGGAGFVGSHLIDRLLSEGHEVITLDNLSTGQLNFLKQHQKNPRFQFIKLDLLDSQELEKVLSPSVDMVYHLSANSDISKGFSNPQIDFDHTIRATYHLLSIMKEKAVKKLLFASGSGVYGDWGSRVLAENSGPLFPTSMYGASKLAAEALICAFANLYEWTVWILRPANIIGPRATHGVIFDFINKLRKNPDELEILGDGQQSKSYLYISDVIEAMVKIPSKTTQRINLFNLASSDSITVNEIAKMVTGEMNLSETQFRWTGGRGGWKGDVPIIRLDAQALRQLGWQPKFSSGQAVKKTIGALLGEPR